MAEHESVKPAKVDVQEIWYQGQRVLRTVVQVVLGAAATLAVLVVVAPQILDALTDVLPASWIGWLTGAIAFLAAVSAALAKVMAIPKVNEFLTWLGLGSTPRAVAKEQAAAKTQGLQPAQFPPSSTDLRDEQAGT